MIAASITVNKTKIPTQEAEYVLQIVVKTLNKLLRLTSGAPFEHRVELRATNRGLRSGVNYGRRVICRININGRYPYVDRYVRYKEMPEMEIRDWTEQLVHIFAHELAHYKFTGNKGGEFKCELAAHDTLDIFRKKHRAAYDIWKATKLAQIIAKEKTKAKAEKKKNTKAFIRSVLKHSGQAGLERMKEAKRRSKWVKDYIKKHGIMASSTIGNRMQWDHGGYLDLPDGYVWDTSKSTAYAGEENKDCIWVEDIGDAYEKLVEMPIIPAKPFND